MPPTLKKLKRHIALGLSVHASVRPFVRLLQKLSYKFEISSLDFTSKISPHYRPLWSYAPFKGP